MTEPLNQEVAEKYGYSEEGFRGWAKRYIDSLNLDTLNFEPILNKDDLLEYVLSDRNIDDWDKYYILNAGYIYLLHSNTGKNTHFIPVSEPFPYQNGHGEVPKMNGLFVIKNESHTYTTKGFNHNAYTIIGVAPFLKTGASRFLNWKHNPLEVTE